MALTFPTGGNGGDFQPLEAGTYLAVCDILADIGYQPGSQAYPAPKRKVYLRFQVPSERMEDGRPKVIGTKYTASMNEKAILRHHLEGWRGRKFTDQQAAEFDVSSVLGKPCMISVVENEKGGKTYSNISSISAVPKGTQSPPVNGDLLLYTGTEQDVYGKLPEFLQKQIDAQLPPPAPSRKSNGQQPQVEDFADDEIPF
jgi:hypothetical protein